LATLRTSLLLAFRSLPLLLIGFIGFLAFGLGNTSLFILLAGQMFAVPALTEILHWLTSKTPSLSLLMSNSISELVPSAVGNPVNVFPSYWMAHISFFFGYLLSNAVSIYLQKPDLSIIQGASSDAVKASINEKLKARKEKAMTLMMTTVLFYIVLIILRVIATGAESLAGITVAIVILGLAGAGWYYFALFLGASNIDVFGIGLQMMSPDSAATKPKTCVYTGRP